MNNITFKKNFLLFIIFSIIFAVFFLYIKHNVGNDSSISEWLINYNGGFTKRGIGGEIAIMIANLFELSLRQSIFFIQSLAHITYLVLIFFYLKNLKVNIIQVFAIYVPLFLLYPIAEIEALGRKEIVLFLSFIVALFLCEKKNSKKYINIYSFFILPIVILLWEEVVLFFPFFAAVIIIQNNLNTFSKVFKNLLIIFFPSILTFAYVWLNPLSAEGHVVMCAYLQSEFGERCYMSAKLLMSNTIYFSTFDVVHQNANLEHYIRYILIFLIGFFPLNLLVSQNKFLKKNNFITNNFKLNILFFLLYSPSILLFIYAYDWGRWTHMTYSFSILFYIYLFKNSIISNNLKIKNDLWKSIVKKKILVSLIFFIFAFCWNPKTVITGDVASFPIYRIPYKAFKIINNW